LGKIIEILMIHRDERPAALFKKRREVHGSLYAELELWFKDEKNVH
jgi:hypothetical protein